MAALASHTQALRESPGPTRTRTQRYTLCLQHTVHGTEAGAKFGRDGLDGETLFVQVHRASPLRLRQWLTAHPDTTIVEQLEHTRLRDAEPLGQRRRANARSIQLHQLGDLLVAETAADEPGATRLIQVSVGICRHDRGEFSQLLQLFQSWKQPSRFFRGWSYRAHHVSVPPVFTPMTPDADHPDMSRGAGQDEVMQEQRAPSAIQPQPSGEVLLYQRDDGAPALDVRLDTDTVWLSQQQIAELFQTSRENITMHLRHVYDEGELDRETTSKDFLQVRVEGVRSVRRSVAHYNLDAILSVGYRVKSATATQFRIWATAQLRDYLVRGYVVNTERLEQLGTIVQILGRSTDELVSGVADVLRGYLPGLTLLRDYDEGRIYSEPSVVPGWELTHGEARGVIGQLREQFPDETLFGRERGDGLSAIVSALYQTFAGQELYPTVEEKAAHLLYLLVKDHPLSDGNKRTAAALFVTFLARNGILDNVDGTLRVSNNALAATTLLVAMSDPKEKDIMISLLVKIVTG